MLVKTYYVIYVEVPSGYPGVEAINMPWPYYEWETLEWQKKNLREAAWNAGRRYAVLDILEAH